MELTKLIDGNDVTVRMTYGAINFPGVHTYTYFVAAV